MSTEDIKEEIAAACEEYTDEEFEENEIDIEFVNLIKELSINFDGDFIDEENNYILDPRGKILFKSSDRESIYLNGFDQHIRISKKHGLLNLNNANFKIEISINTMDENGFILNTSNTNSNSIQENAICLQIRNGILYLIEIVDGETSEISTDTYVSDDTWHDIKIVRENGVGTKIYVDGVKMANFDYMNIFTYKETQSYSDTINLGSINDSASYQTYYRGYIDKFIIYSGSN